MSLFKLVKLADVSDLITKGTTPKTLGIDFSDHGIPFIRVEDIIDGVIRVSEKSKFISEDSDQILGRSRIYPGDVLISIAGTIGRTAIVPSSIPRLNCNQAVAIIRPGRDLDANFLRHWLESPVARRQINSAKVSATISNLSLGEIGKLEIRLPSLVEQRQIAFILSKVESLRSKRQESIQLANEFLRAVFIDMFGDPVSNPKGWEVNTLGKICSKIGSGATPRGGDAAYKDEGIALIRSMNVRDGYFLWKDLARIDEEQAQRLSNVVVQIDDVLINITGASVARVCRAPQGALPARVNQHVSILRPKAHVRAPFLEQILRSSSVKSQLLRIGESGATRQAITKLELESFFIIVPPENIQDRFCQIQSSVADFVSKISESFDITKQLAVSLQSKIFD